MQYEGSVNTLCSLEACMGAGHWPGARKAGLKPGARAVNLQEWTGLDCLLCKDFI